MIQNLLNQLDLPIVFAAFIISILTSFTAYDFFIRLSNRKGVKKILWQLYGAIVIGIGIWTAHFLSMMSFLQFHSFDAPVVFLSLLLSITLLYLLLEILVKGLERPKYFLGGRISFGLIFLILHFIGMEAVSDRLVYSPMAVLVSMVLSIFPPFFLMKMVMNSAQSHSRASIIRTKVISSFFIGINLVVVHYITLIGLTVRVSPSTHKAIHQDSYLFVGLVLGSVLILIIFLLSSFIERKFTKQSLKLAHTEQHYQSLFKYNPDIVVNFDRDGVIISINQAIEKITGFKMEDFISRHYDQFVVSEYVDVTNEHFHKAVEGTATNYQSALYHKNGSLIDISVTNIPIVIDDGIVGVYGIVKDITEQKNSEKMIQYTANHDYLTGLPNRKLLNQRFLHQREKNQRLAILFIDLDRFKVINDTLGHSVGDLLLQEVAKRLKASVHGKDVVFRQGGDEFIVILEDADREVASMVATRILKALSASKNINSYDIFVTPSIGISLFPVDGEKIETLIKQAAFAMYQAKAAGKNTFRFYSGEVEKNHTNPLQIEMELHKSIQRNELILHYQPKVNLKTGRIIGTEALLRWKHPEWGLVSPGEFIPIAEETGLIIPIGEWALRTACQQNKKWHDQGFSNLVVSVNLSACQFSQKNLVRTIASILLETGLDAKYLELEITESMTVDIERTIITLQNLKKLGVLISIDDFGTGFSSLNYLNRFPVDTLKIDQSFVRELHHNPSDETIVKTIISMAHNLNLNVVAEGIETAEQLMFLQQHLCDIGQGYFFSKPLLSNELEKNFKEIEKIVHSFGISQDLNERLWSEELIQNARRELQETVRLQQGMTLKFKGMEGRFFHTLCDGELVYRLGFTPKQVLGKELFDFLPEDRAIEKNKYYQRAWNGEENVTYEAELNGVYYLTALTPIKRGGEIVEVIGSCVDITEFKKMERELHKSQEMYRLVAENTQDLITIFDVDGSILYASPAHEFNLGYPPSYFEGSHSNNLYHPEEYEKLKGNFLKTIETKQPSQHKLRIKKRDGGWCLFDSLLTPVFDDDGQVKQVIGVARNITEKKEVEKQLLKSEQLSIVGEIAAEVAYEIRSPITAIRGLLKLLQQNPVNQEYFTIIQTELNMIEEVINEFITESADKLNQAND
ncbi:EAL domain-containing protein [Metabacillus halosaccharovorans]|uniref:EAL domain-containing protein n=1 Tax=Metabacillus halosaccharovorans TaxID=930124 RepID=UPI00203C75EB|nr:EAL domain-containing protein [Metabacillus halosaccharovorans]MCM3443395.1 EAL domain-containing protein [Metabacillus halosaccharovorans]